MQMLRKAAMPRGTGGGHVVYYSACEMVWKKKATNFCNAKEKLVDELD